MYNAYFNFKEAPFSIAPDPRYLYMTEQHREALAHLVYGLNSEGGCILLTGEVGTGKTTVCRCLLEQIPEHTNIALVVNPKVTAIELLETICDELNIEYPAGNNSIKIYIDRINDFLITANARNEKTVLIIDEAQNLDNTVLEQLRLLTNLETNQRKLLQIIILGQPELLDILARQEMRQLAQRITARYHLNGLSRNEVKAYINHRLAIAGQNAQLFPEQTIAQLFRLSRGIPRLLNVLCDRALLGTYVQNKPVVDAKTLSIAAKEVFGELGDVQKKSQLIYFLRIAAIVSSIAVAAALLFILIDKNDAETMVDKPVTTSAPVQTENKIIEKEPATVKIIAEKIKPNPIPEFIQTAFDENKEAAFVVLLGKWQPDFHSETAVCDDPTHGLSCFLHRGNLNSLRKLNRPAVLKLYNEAGQIAYLTLSAFNNNELTLETGKENFNVEAEQLEKYWYGEFTLLWQPPPFYQGAILPDSNGAIVQWLGQQLARLNPSNQAPMIHDVYSQELVAQVKTFQQSKGLVADGIAGPLTLIQLNAETGVQAPLLNEPPVSER